MDAAVYAKRVEKLPSLPPIYYQLTKAVDDPRASISDIGDVVRKDQSLATRLLKLANSAFYSLSTQVETIEQALQLVGLKEMRDLALATCIIGAFKHLPTGPVKPKDFWKHSISSAVTSGLLAERIGGTSPERLFVGGLLHDMGRLVLYTTAVSETEKIFARGQTVSEPVCKSEVAVLGFDHADLGAELLSHWRLPPNVVEMVRQHHSPTQATLGPLDTSIVHLADFIVTGLDLGNSGEFTVSPLFDEALKRCEIPESDVVGLIREIEDKSDQLSAILTKD